jgi:hypothetical protein
MAGDDAKTGGTLPAYVLLVEGIVLEEATVFFRRLVSCNPLLSPPSFHNTSLPLF